MKETQKERLITLCLSANKSRELNDKAFKDFSKDFARYSNRELTFRELMAGVKEPTGALREAMKVYYAGSNYSRSFKTSKAGN